ncbi:hypothetical protein [Chamaesiphon sp.]|uniref:hypothetical protein n=1 Tax=Chamaesiphon sp. TaxID=2814140 RepID=UPI00359356F2
MNNITQTIALTAVVFAPVSLISSIDSAAAHHTPSHVSTVAGDRLRATQKKTTPASMTVQQQMSGKKTPARMMTNFGASSAPGASTAPSIPVDNGTDTPATLK